MSIFLDVCHCLCDRFMMNLFIILVVFIINCLSYASSRTACVNLRTCSACIGYASERCKWCYDDSNMTQRCQPASQTDSNWCKNGKIQDPSYNINPIQFANFSSKVQIRPQLLKIKARPGAVVPFEISYKPAEGFPLDVYFLMDLTYTMKQYRENLKKQFLEIYRTLTNLTQNVRFGVGSFIEKPGLPYTDIMNTNYYYSFKNHLNLTNNTSDFQSAIETDDKSFGSNYDDAEAGLDALMQVMVCDQQLGWRKETRRIILLATDNTYHSAGDGKMVGAIKPNDRKCHLENNEYKREDSLKYDYPSVSLISKEAQDRKFLIVFSSTENFKTEYSKLSDAVIGSKYAILTEKPDSILEIIKKVYEDSVKQAVMTYIAPPDSFEIKFAQDCSKDPKTCEISPNNNTLTVNVTITSKKCQNSETISIYPIGLEEKLTVSFETDCLCDCEKDVADLQRLKCSNKGSFLCGVCSCDKNRGGEICQLECSDDTAQELRKYCIPKDRPNSTFVCSGHGTCRCGECKCEEPYEGSHCQYSPESCNKFCDNHGSCKLGKCHCDDDDVWTGENCDCPTEKLSKKQCTGPFSKNVCSGHGTCNCGQCTCNKVPNTDKFYLGLYCDLCDECEAIRCNELKAYAICNHKQSKKSCDEKFNETNVEVTVDKRRHLRNMEEWKVGSQCRIELEDKTFLIFKYTPYPKDKTKLYLMIQKETESPQSSDIGIPVASAILGILLVGILTAVLWKVFMDMYDKREYDKFCAEAKSQGYETTENVLYQPPTQNFVNPGFENNM